MPDKFRYERDMRPAVDQWVRNQGLFPFYEFLIDHMVDVVAVEFEPRTTRLIPPVIKAIAVELKLTDIAGVRSQTASNSGQMDKSFAAMPSYICDRMQNRTVDSFREKGIGLLSVCPVGGDVCVIVEPTKKGVIHSRMRKKLWRRYRDEK